MTDLDTLCVELTLRCPLRCVHCSANAAPERDEMIDERLLLARLRELGPIQAVYLSGGEPFEHPGLPGLVEAVAGLADEVAIYSSGVMLGPAGGEPLSERAIRGVSRHVSRVDVSVYSMSPAEHDAVTGLAGSFDLTLQTIRRLRLCGVPFGIHFVPVGTGSVLPLAQFAREAGAERFHVLAVARQGRAASLDVEPSPGLLDDLRVLLGARIGIDVAVSSQLRRALAFGATPRDELRAAFMDVRGHLHRSEGERARGARSLRSIGEAGVVELLADLA
ncbi:MAG TPA: radical SAM protein [Kofleriaceae bacterium]|nr:radical SAM protein [Kofleriaceae bacterium]